ncbi:hypothetical protein D3C80_1522110 [compost metagenome]
MATIIWKTCEMGHRFQKSSDCPACPKCAELSRPEEGLLSRLSAPARRALESHNIHNASALAAYCLEEVLSWHGIGKASIPIFMGALEQEGLSFKE